MSQGPCSIRTIPWSMVLRLAALLVVVSARHVEHRCSVTDFGADASGVKVSTAQIQHAIDACGTVFFPEGTFVTGTMQLRDDLVMEIPESAVILGAPSNLGEYLTPEPNPWPDYQDSGHSGWSDALFYGYKVRNVTITGSGVVDGNGGLSTGAPPVGGGCKMFSFVDSQDIRIVGPLEFKHGGWFTMLLTNCDRIYLHGFTIQADRDGIDLMQSRNVEVKGITVFGGGDDALKFGSDYSRGRIIPSYNIHVHDSVLGSSAVDAIVIGSETIGDFYNFSFRNITLTDGMAGIGLTSYDGANIHDLSFEDIRMNRVAAPFYFGLYSRLRRPNDENRSVDEMIGSISNIAITNVLAANLTANMTPSSSKSHHYSESVTMIDGLPERYSRGVTHAHSIGGDIVFSNITLSYPGRGAWTPKCLDPEPCGGKYPMLDPPAYAWYLRNTHGVALHNVVIKVPSDIPDGRPAIVIQNSSDVTLAAVVADRSSGSRYDLELRKSTGLQQLDGTKLVLVEDPCETLTSLV